MALIKDFIDPATGIIVSYWAASINLKDNQGNLKNVVLSGYVDKASKVAGYKPICKRGAQVDIAKADVSLAKIYESIKAFKPVEEEGEYVVSNFFADAEDDI